jgi:hypothetical protein
MTVSCGRYQCGAGVREQKLRGAPKWRFPLHREEPHEANISTRVSCSLPMAWLSESVPAAMSRWDWV